MTTKLTENSIDRVGIQSENTDASFIRAVYDQSTFFWRLLAGLRLKILPSHEILRYIPREGSLLDIGCGAGMIAFLIAKKSPSLKIVGFDRSASAIESARVALQSAARKNVLDPSTIKDFQFLLENEFDKNCEDLKFDAITMIDVIHHVPKEYQKDFWLKNAGKLKRGGVFIYKDMCQTPFWRATANRIHDLVMARQWINYVPISNVASWAKEAGLETVKTHKHDILWYGHEFAIMKRP